MAETNGKAKEELKLDLLSPSDDIDPCPSAGSLKKIRFFNYDEIDANDDDGGETRSSSAMSKKERLFSRGVSLQRGISTLSRKTIGFFSVNEDLKETDPHLWALKQEKRKILRQQHLDKFSRKPTFKKSAPKDVDSVDGHPHPHPHSHKVSEGDDTRIACDLGEIMDFSRNSIQCHTLPRKRENAMKVLWKAAQRSLSTRPTHEDFLGSSYLQSDLTADDASSVFESDCVDGIPSTPSSLATVTPVLTPTIQVGKEKFFDFDVPPRSPLNLNQQDGVFDMPDGVSPTIESLPPADEIAPVKREKPPYVTF